MSTAGGVATPSYRGKVPGKDKEMTLAKNEFVMDMRAFGQECPEDSVLYSYYRDSAYCEEVRIREGADWVFSLPVIDYEKTIGLYIGLGRYTTDKERAEGWPDEETWCGELAIFANFL